MRVQGAQCVTEGLGFVRLVAVLVLLGFVAMVPVARSGGAANRPSDLSGVQVKHIKLEENGEQILHVQEFDSHVDLKTSKLRVRVQKNPWLITVFDKAGNLLAREVSGKALQYGEQRVKRVRNHESLGRVKIIKRDPPYYHAEDEAVIVGESVRFTCETTESGRAAQVHITFRNPAVFSVWMTVPEMVQKVRTVFESAADEHFFGLGECWNAQSLDLKGLSVTMSNEKGTPDQGGYVPFYLSTRGYGILIDNYLPVNFDYTQPDTVTITAPPIVGSADGEGYYYGSTLLWYFYYGPSLLDVIDRFTEHVSRPAQPPSWALFAPWQWRDTATQENVYADARGMRDAKIPCGLIWIDRPWATGDSNMPPPFAWEPGRYPDGHKMFMDLNEMGYKTGVWVAKNLYGDLDDPVLVEKLKRDAQAWLRHDQCQMYKIDRGNEQRMDPYFTCQAYWEAWNEVFHGDFITLPRVVAFRANKYVNGKWPGDNDNTYEYPSGLKANVAVMLNLAISGFPYWGSDTGGFPDPPGNEVTIRWAQFSALCPIFETAGTPYLYKEPYRSIFRQYAELYTQLFPYRWTYARLAHDKGYPITRALALADPEDRQGYNQKNEYLFGDWLLAAPMVAGGTQREVYLPEGRWIDWWDGAVYEGKQTIQYEAALEKLPLLVRAGAIIPMIEPQQTWKDSSMSPMTLRIYPAGHSRFTIRADDLTYPDHPEPYTDLEHTEIECRAAGKGVELDISESSVDYRLELHLMKNVASIEVDGRAATEHASKATLEQADEGWYHDAAAGTLWILVPTEGKSAHQVKISTSGSA